MLTLEQLLKLRRVNTRNRNVRTQAVNHQSEQQKDKPTTQIAELTRFCCLSRVCCHLLTFAYANLRNASAGCFDRSFGTSGSTNTIQFDCLGNRTGIDNLHHFGQLTYEASLLERQQINV